MSAILKKTGVSDLPSHEKSSTSEFLTQYNFDIAEMAKTVVNKLALEL